MPTHIDNLAECPIVRLAEVASIRLGFTPIKEKRGDYADDASRSNRRLAGSDFVRRTVLMLQPSNIAEDGTIDWPRLERVNVLPKQSYESHALQPGSVLLCLRGVMRVANLTSKTLTHDLDATAEPLPIVASGAWAVIHPHRDLLTATYLTWHLKLPSTTRQLLQARTGTALQFIPISAVQEMHLPVPSRDTQDAVARTAGLIDQVEKLEQQRLALLRTYLSGSIRSERASRHEANDQLTSNRGTAAH